MAQHSIHHQSGGICTIEEYFETLSGFQTNPIVLYSVGGFYDCHMTAFRYFEEQNFMRNTKTANLDLRTAPAGIVG